MVVQLSLPIVPPSGLPYLASLATTIQRHTKGLTFIDLFAGIGGFHQALTSVGMTCVFASEIDEPARKTYLANHALNPALFNQDIRTLSPDDVPDHDILCAGFPCQPFSQAGYKKGFTDAEHSERGNLFFCILDILEAKRPKAFILENVRHLLNHDDGNTFATIYQQLTNLNYAVFYKVLKASDYGRPQHRPRIYIVGFNKQYVNTDYAFNFPSPIPLQTTLSDVWEGACDRTIGFTLRVGGRGSGLHA
jgi:DNA (cytosine-5)-methyltransferase 1